MITVTVSFKPSESSAEVIAQMVKLLAELENSVTTEPNSESGSNSVEVEVKSIKLPMPRTGQKVKASPAAQ